MTPFPPAPPEVGRLRVGVDIVEIARIGESIDCFGERYLDRLFTAGEIAYASSGGAELRAERLAARFAAKEAVMKALDLAERGVSWKDIEVRRESSGQCELALHGRARAAARDAGIQDLALSLSHDGNYAIAFVVARPRNTPG